MAIGTFQIGTARARGEGLRVGAVRILPRGVYKKDYARLDYFDVRMPLLAPSRKLLAWVHTQDLDKAATCRTFFAKYRRELLGNTERKQTILLLAALGKTTDLCVGCYCSDERKCHRSELSRLLTAAAEGRLERLK